MRREAAEKTSWVLTDPAPEVYFLEFGESSLDGQLILWTNNYDYAWNVQDYVNRRILIRFREEKIEERPEFRFARRRNLGAKKHGHLLRGGRPLGRFRRQAGRDQLCVHQGD